jgi:hypothetical protein
MKFAAVVLVVLLLIILAVLPVWPYSRAWGYGPTILIGTVLVVLLIMTLRGQVPGLEYW